VASALNCTLDCDEPVVLALGDKVPGRLGTAAVEIAGRHTAASARDADGALTEPAFSRYILCSYRPVIVSWHERIAACLRGGRGTIEI
jgi:hypothetical protein